MSPRTPEEDSAAATPFLDPETDMRVKKATQLLATLFQVSTLSSHLSEPPVSNVYSVPDPIRSVIIWLHGSGAMIG